MSYLEFRAIIETLANEYIRTQDQYYEFWDYCHEAANGTENVIYTGKAWDLVNMIRMCHGDLLDTAEEALEGAKFDGIHAHMTALAYEIIYQALSLEIQERLMEEE